MTRFKLGKRNIRTLLLGSTAFLAICYALLAILEIPVADVLLLIVVSVVLVVLLAAAGLLAAALLYKLKKLWRR